jgi:hypothetical protein
MIRKLCLLGLFLAGTTTVHAMGDDPRLSGCSYMQNDPQAATVATTIMPLPLPYLDNQRLVYRDNNFDPIGYAVRRALHIFFYDINGVPLGTAIRRTETRTSYFAPGGIFVGTCVRHKMEAPAPLKRFDPRLDPNKNPD